MKFTVAKSIEVGAHNAIEIDGVPLPYFTSIEGLKREPFNDDPDDLAEIVWIGIFVDPQDDYEWEVVNA